MLHEMNVTAIILPGIGNSGPDHWQSLWEKTNPSFMRIQHRDWDAPVCDEWVEDLESTLSRLDPNVVLVAHSLACVLMAHWAKKTRLTIRGALLAAPPNPDGPAFPKEAVGFSPLPERRLPFPSIVVASTNDPYGKLGFAISAAKTWGSRFVNIGAAGHINSQSGFGEWHEGLLFFKQLAS